MLIVDLTITSIIAFVAGAAVSVFIARRAGNTSAWTPEHIAYTLLSAIAKQEGKSLNSTTKGEAPDKKWLLDTFAECMQAVREPSHRLDQKK